MYKDKISRPRISNLSTLLFNEKYSTTTVCKNTAVFWGFFCQKIKELSHFSVKYISTFDLICTRRFNESFTGNVIKL